MATFKLDGRGVLIPCTACGKTNRVPFTALGRTTRCASCHAGLTAPGEPVEVRDAAAFDALIASSSLPVVVDFWAPWCGPCRMMAPELDKVAREAAGEWLVVKVDTDAVPELGERFRIRSIPTLALFQGGREVERAAGARAAADIRAFVSSHLASHTAPHGALH
jgi:thioredoxin 2